MRSLTIFILFMGLSACTHSGLKPTSDPKSEVPADTYLGNAFDENPLRWQMISDQNGMKLYRDVDSAPGRIDLRAKTNVNASIAKIATALTDFEVRKKWLDGMAEGKIVRQISEYERIEYTKLKAQWPYQFTDFVYQVTYSVLRNPQTLLIRMTSVNDQSIPVPDGTIRGQITHSYNFVRQIDVDHSELAIEIGLDPKGAFPSWDKKGQVVFWFSRTLTTLKTIVEDPKFKVSAEIQNYIKNHDL